MAHRTLLFAPLAELDWPFIDSSATLAPHLGGERFALGSGSFRDFRASGNRGGAFAGDSGRGGPGSNRVDQHDANRFVNVDHPGLVGDVYRSGGYRRRGAGRVGDLHRCEQRQRAWQRAAQ